MYKKLMKSCQPTVFTTHTVAVVLGYTGFVKTVVIVRNLKDT